MARSCTADWHSVTVQMYLVIILHYTGCYEVVCPVVTKESIT